MWQRPRSDVTEDTVHRRAGPARKWDLEADLVTGSLDLFFLGSDPNPDWFETNPDRFWVRDPLPGL